MPGIFVVGVGMILEREGKLLLARRSSHRDFAPNLWEFPAGRLETGEDPEVGLVREGKEELAVDLLPRGIVDAYTFLRKGTPMVLITYLCSTEGEPKRSTEHDELRWCTSSEAHELLSFDQQKRTLKRYLTRYENYEG